jgi:hypothetical protein
MALIKNALFSPLTVELLHGKVILLGPRATQTITEEEFQSPGCQKLFRAGKVNVLPQPEATGHEATGHSETH